MEQMDVDSLNSPPETQVGFMNMMLQLQQLASSSEARLPQTHQFSTAPMHTFQTSPTTTASPIFSGPLDRTTTPMLNNLTPIGNAGPSTQSCLFLAHRPISTSAMREMVFLTAAMQPICVDPESVKRPKRRNVRISKDPHSVAARLRRERISERMRTLQRMVPGGTKMDTASMLDQAIHYVKFLKTQVQSLERAVADRSREVAGQPPTAALMTCDSYRARFWDM